MSLKEELKGFIGRKRRFLLLRISDVDIGTAMKLCKVPKPTYKAWLKEETFVTVYHRRDEFATEYKQEAIQLLRRHTQLQAALLEEKIIAKLQEEIESGDYVLTKTLLARDVYTRLMGDLDRQPIATTTLTWEQRFQQLNIEGQQREDSNNQIVEGVINILPEGENS